MSQASTIRQLTKSVHRATRSARFCVSGCLPPIDPGIEVEKIGPITLPMDQAQSRKLISRCRMAPFGKGTQTLVDTNVRNSLELDPGHFRLNREWTQAIEDLAPSVARELGLPADQIEVHLYKLLVYESGGFFLPHRDSEKQDGMVASLVVVLPNRFSGGDLTLRHGVAYKSFYFREAARGEAPSYVAFYTDCQHEVGSVYNGVRISLAYNIVLKPDPKSKPSPKKKGIASGPLQEAIEAWTAAHPSQPLVFALDHYYTERGLSIDLLKGGDRRLADTVIAAAEEADCTVQLAQVTRHLLQGAEDGSFDRYPRWGKREPPANLEIFDTYEDELHGAQWADLDGKKQLWGEIPFKLSSIVSAIPIDKWKPSLEEYEGFTGNEGNTLDRWYHRSAIVIWHRDHHYEIIARSGAAGCIPLFQSMVKKLARTAKKRHEEARGDCIRFARAIIERWPGSQFSYGPPTRDMSSPLMEFPSLLLLLHDQESNSRFLAKVAECDQTMPLDSFIISICREFGWAAFTEELKKLIETRPDDRFRRRQELPIRDVKWLAAYCENKNSSSEKAALAKELCRMAVDRFCVPFPPPSPYNWADERTKPTDSESAVPFLVRALVAGSNRDDLLRLIQFIENSSDDLTFDYCRVPCLKTVVPWAQKRFKEVDPHLFRWLESVKQKLESATAQEPVTYKDWARPSAVDCDCRFCSQLTAFLADRETEVSRIPANENRRRHLTDVIRQHRCDVQHKLEKRGSPYSLVLTKTFDSYERAAQRYKLDCKLLKEIERVYTKVATA